MGGKNVSDPNLALFEELLREKNALSSTEETNKIQKEYESRLRARWIRLNGEGTYSIGAAIELLGDTYDAFLKPYQDRANEAYQNVKQQKESLNKQLEQLTQEIQIYNSPTDVTVYSTHCESSYLTQGYGARIYAQGQAEMDAAKCYMIGINSGVVIREDEYNKREMIFDCRVTTTALETEVLRYKVGQLSIRDCLKLCLQRCLNPRVYWPMLPWGLEEKLGLGMRGEDLPGYVSTV